jgi:hypothetical protein
MMTGMSATTDFFMVRCFVFILAFSTSGRYFFRIFFLPFMTMHIKGMGGNA